MRIAISASGLGHIARGVEAWAADLAAALADRDVPVTLYKGAGRPEADYEQVISCWQQGAPRTKRLLRLLPSRGMWRVGLGSAHQIEQTSFALGLIRALRRDRIDLVHMQDPLVALIVQRAWRLGLIRTVPILAHGTEEPLEFQRKIEFLQHLAPWHLEHSRAAGAWKPTWTAIPNFIDTDTFRPGRCDELRAEMGIAPDELVVLTVAAIKRHHKRIDYLLNEFARFLGEWRGRRVTLIVSGGRTSATEELVELGKRSLGDRVRFLVSLPREKMASLYRSADAFVLCSLFEMMPIAVLEATASGLPCLVHHHPVLRWMVGPGGEHLNLQAPGGLAAGLGELLTNQELRMQLGAAARQHCIQSFGRDQVVDQILDYYAFTAENASQHKRRRVSRVLAGTSS
jgi:glycosyltransferase involved in cell wall biosynthesis